MKEWKNGTEKGRHVTESRVRSWTGCSSGYWSSVLLGSLLYYVQQPLKLALQAIRKQGYLSTSSWFGVVLVEINFIHVGIYLLQASKATSCGSQTALRLSSEASFMQGDCTKISTWDKYRQVLLGHGIKSQWIIWWVREFYPFSFGINLLLFPLILTWLNSWKNSNGIILVKQLALCLEGIKKSANVSSLPLMFVRKYVFFNGS